MEPHYVERKTKQSYILLNEKSMLNYPIKRQHNNAWTLPWYLIAFLHPRKLADGWQKMWAMLAHSESVMNCIFIWSFHGHLHNWNELCVGLLTALLIPQIPPLSLIQTGCRMSYYLVIWFQLSEHIKYTDIKCEEPYHTQHRHGLSEMFWFKLASNS